MASPVVESFSGVTVEDFADQTITLTKPSGTVSGELLFAVIGADDTRVFPAVSGWTLIIEEQHTTGGSVCGALYYKVTGGSEPSTYDLDIPPIAGSVMMGGILRISGADNSAPIDISDVSITTANDAVCPDVTTTVIDTLVIRFFAGDNDDHPSTDSGYPTSHTGLWASDTTTGNDMMSGVAHIAQSGIGATGTGTFTDVDATQELVNFTVVIAPAAGGLSIPIAMHHHLQHNLS